MPTGDPPLYPNPAWVRQAGLDGMAVWGSDRDRANRFQEGANPDGFFFTDSSHGTTPAAPVPTVYVPRPRFNPERVTVGPECCETVPPWFCDVCECTTEHSKLCHDTKDRPPHRNRKPLPDRFIDVKALPD